MFEYKKNNLRYNLFSIGVIFASFPFWYILSIITILLLDVNLTEEEYNTLIDGAIPVFFISNTYVWLMILFILNKRFDFKKLDILIYSLIGAGIFENIIPYFIKSEKTVDSIMEYSLFLSSLFFIIGGVILKKSFILYIS